MTTTERTVIVTRHTRNLGYAWNNTPRQSYDASGQGRLVIDPPTVPAVIGGLRAVWTEHGRARQSDAFCETLFVGGARVVAVEDVDLDLVQELWLRLINPYGDGQVRVTVVDETE